MSNEQTIEQLGDQIERLLNLAAALEMPLPDHLHVDQLRKSLPEITADLRKVYADLAGEDPWGDA
ncbi:hypothetical protein [Pseudomonas oryzihabitans]|uniref:hypothetical protein n=1 Tax=Pseudomonas oryzihabitans TaxID=47885 RepID=UPI00111D5B53|nr:hypothetical protein [Pseudomonas psychrotolerans]